MKWLPDPSWWFRMQPGREGHWWRTHVVAHVGHGALFCLAWWFIGVTHPWAAALFFAVLWEAWQRETWPAMPLVENVWDVILSGVGIGLTWWVLA